MTDDPNAAVGGSIYTTDRGFVALVRPPDYDNLNYLRPLSRAPRKQCGEREGRGRRRVAAGQASEDTMVCFVSDTVIVQAASVIRPVRPSAQLTSVTDPAVI